MRLTRGSRYALTAVGILAAWALLAFGAQPARELCWGVAEAIWGVEGPSAAEPLFAAALRWMEIYAAALAGATFAAPLAIIVRMFARARARGGRDVLAPLRARLASPPWWLRALVWAPAAVTLAVFTGLDPITTRLAPLSQAVAFAAGLPAIYAFTALVRRYLVLLASPPAQPEERVAIAAPADEIYFSAVAVTREASGLVGAFVALTVGVVVAFGRASIAQLAELGIGAAVAYAALAAVAVAAYRRASRIAVGLDGVLVTGTSRRRFYPYRDLDGVGLTTFDDIMLVARGREVLRLQLHGDDAARISSIVERIEGGIHRARAEAAHGAQRFAESASAEGLARAARGHADYRARATTRDDLLALVESPATPPEARAAAAEALAHAVSAEDHVRLQEAADRCADPRARAALLRVAGLARDAAAEQEALAASARGARPAALRASR